MKHSSTTCERRGNDAGTITITEMDGVLHNIVLTNGIGGSLLLRKSEATIELLQEAISVLRQEQERKTA